MRGKNQKPETAKNTQKQTEKALTQQHEQTVNVRMYGECIDGIVYSKSLSVFGLRMSMCTAVASMS